MPPLPHENSAPPSPSSTSNSTEKPSEGEKSPSSPVPPKILPETHQNFALPEIPKHGPVALSFSGCGFLGTYHFGVIMCFQKHAKGLLERCDRVAGASAGSLVGGLYVLAPERIEEGLHNLYKLADELNGLTFGALTPGFFLNEKLTSIIHEYIPVNINHAQKKLHVSLTNQNTRQNVLMSAFENREYLMRCLMASCFIPLYSSGIRSEAPVIDGIPYVDGGFSENLHIFGDTPTISVSPFSGSARIAPNDQSPVAGKLFGEWRMRFGNQYLKVNMQNIVRGAQALFPPSREVLTSYWEMGYRDGMKFLLDEALFERDEGSEV